MKYFIPTLLLVLLLCTSGRAQVNWDNIRIETSRNTVVATGGLNLRAAPGTHGKVVAKLPYATKVEVLEEKLFSPDSVNVFHKWLTVTNGWAKVKAGLDTGYVYDAYLYNHTASPNFPTAVKYPPDINTKYRLVSNYGDASGAYDPFTYKWFGLYLKEDACTLERIRPSFRYFPGEIEERLDMVADKQPFFFIGGPQAWATGKRPGRVTRRTGTEEDHRRASEVMCSANGISIEPAGRSDWASSNEFTLNMDGISQHLAPGGSAGTALYLEAAADFDGDGRNDFIISYDLKEWSTSVVYVLFLSSEAKPGELVRPVAMHYTYQGC